MGPIQPTGHGAANSSSGMLRAGDLVPRPGVDASRGGSVAPSASGQTGAAGSVMRIDMAVTQLLQSIGGGVENDKLLRLMIALLLLLTILGHQQEQQAQAQSVWGGLSMGNSGSSSSVELYSSTTTISIEQSYTSITIAENYGSADQGSDTPPAQLDAVA